MKSRQGNSIVQKTGKTNGIDIVEGISTSLGVSASDDGIRRWHRHRTIASATEMAWASNNGIGIVEGIGIGIVGGIGSIDGVGIGIVKDVCIDIVKDIVIKVGVAIVEGIVILKGIGIVDGTITLKEQQHHTSNGVNIQLTWREYDCIQKK